MDNAEKEALIVNMAAAVEKMLTFYADGIPCSGPDAASRAWEVLAHLPYWHQAVAWGLDSAAHGGPPWRLPGSSDEINEVSLRLHHHESPDEIVTQLDRAHAQLLTAANAVGDLDAIAAKTPDGNELSARWCMNRIADHWSEHLDELQQLRG